MSQQDREKAAKIVAVVGFSNSTADLTLATILIDRIATALEQRGAEEREAAARKCDDIAKQHRHPLQTMNINDVERQQMITDVASEFPCIGAILEARILGESVAKAIESEPPQFAAGVYVSRVVDYIVSRLRETGESTDNE